MSIGFCFLDSGGDHASACDARLIRWSKQIEVPSVVGQMIGAGLLKHLEQPATRGALVI